MVGVIVIGGSAGAMNVIPVLLRGLPRPLPCPVLVVLHRGSRVDAHAWLAGRLAKESQRPVQEVEDRANWNSDTILLAPASYDTLIGRDGPALVSPRRPSDAAPSLDEAFASAANAFGADALVVGLSCASTDGLAGARRVLAAGGQAWTVHPDEAEFPVLARPLAELPGARTLGLDELAAELGAICAPGEGASDGAAAGAGVSARDSRGTEPHRPGVRGADPGRENAPGEGPC